MCSAIAFIKRGGTLFQIRATTHEISPSSLNSGIDLLLRPSSSATYTTPFRGNNRGSCHYPVLFMNEAVHFVAFPVILSIDENCGSPLTMVYGDSGGVIIPPMRQDPKQLKRILPDHRDIRPLINRFFRHERKGESASDDTHREDLTVS